MMSHVVEKEQPIPIVLNLECNAELWQKKGIDGSRKYLLGEYANITKDVKVFVRSKISYRPIS